MERGAVCRAMVLVAAAGVAGSAAAGPEWVFHCMPRDPENGDFLLEGGRYLIDHGGDEVVDLTGHAGVSTLVEGVGFVDGSELALFRGGAGLHGGVGGNPENRVDVVFVGDGYTEGELGLYAQQVDAFANEMFADEPLTTYRPLFAVHRVDIVSNESGITNDPNPGISRDTALDMRYWCNNIERLLCVDTFQARSFAATAPFGFDQVVALANSSKYGGAGYPGSDVGTAAAGNSAAAEIVIHELGHAMGNLADEYSYGGPTVFVGPEPSGVNVSKLTQAQMAAQNAKWARWLGDFSPSFDGTTGTFEGGQYSEQGVYRPTNNSKMRSLFRPFNRVSGEALIKEIYRLVDPIDSFSPGNESLVSGRPVLSVDPVDPVGAPLDVEWFVNLVPYEGPLSDGGLSFDTSVLDFSGIVVISAVVTDNTEYVRDEAFRADRMTQDVVWTVQLTDTSACIADVNGDGELNGLDFGAWLSAFNAGLASADQNGDGDVNGLDFGAWLTNFNAGCE